VATSIAMPATITDPMNTVRMSNWPRLGNQPSAMSVPRSMTERNLMASNRTVYRMKMVTTIDSDAAPRKTVRKNRSRRRRPGEPVRIGTPGPGVSVAWVISAPEDTPTGRASESARPVGAVGYSTAVRTVRAVQFAWLAARASGASGTYGTVSRTLSIRPSER
jgi:hypothetical protein